MQAFIMYERTKTLEERVSALEKFQASFLEEPFKYYLCDLEVWPGTDPKILSVDYADGFPRVYLSLDNAIAEINAWLECRNQK